MYYVFWGVIYYFVKYINNNKFCNKVNNIKLIVVINMRVNFE